MNNSPSLQRITSCDDLQYERRRLEALIKHQKYIVRQDLDELKNELKQEIRPALEAASLVKKLTTRETRNETVLQIGSTVLIDLLLRRLFARSNVFIRLAVPALLKNYSSHLLFNVTKNMAHRRR
jgi:hypothetical protein